MADQENNGDLQDIQDELNDSDDDNDDDEEQDLGWHELDWFENGGADLEATSDTPAERSGHVAVVDGSCMYVWGGYKNSEEPGSFDLYLPSHEIWIYSMETGRWRRQLCGGDLPNPMSGSCGVCVEGILYLFGGHHARGNTNLVYRLNLRASDLNWERMKDLNGLPPTRKDKLGCWVYMSRLVYFGGYGYEAEADHRGTFALDVHSLMGNQEGRGWNNHIHILNLEMSAWSQPITKGNAPTPRAAHACASMGNRGYVFGGRYMDHRLNDIHYINMDTWEWTELPVPQHGPVGRSWHSFIPSSSDHIFLFGGFTTNRETLSDAWLYCVTTNEWKEFNHNYKNSPRLWHTSCTGPDGEVFVFGGCTNNLLSHQQASHSNELLIFTVQPKSLLRFCTEVVVRHRHQLENMLDCLPKHLLYGLQQRLNSSTTGGI